MLCSALPADREIKQVGGGLVKQDSWLCLAVLLRDWSNFEQCRFFSRQQLCMKSSEDLAQNKVRNLKKKSKQKKTKTKD